MIKSSLLLDEFVPKQTKCTCVFEELEKLDLHAVMQELNEKTRRYLRQVQARLELNSLDAFLSTLRTSITKHIPSDEDTQSELSPRVTLNDAAVQRLSASEVYTNQASFGQQTSLTEMVSRWCEIRKLDENQVFHALNEDLDELDTRGVIMRLAFEDYMLVRESIKPISAYRLSDRPLPLEALLRLVWVSSADVAKLLCTWAAHNQIDVVHAHDEYELKKMVTLRIELNLVHHPSIVVCDTRKQLHKIVSDVLPASDWVLVVPKVVVHKDCYIYYLSWPDIGDRPIQEQKKLVRAAVYQKFSCIVKGRNCGSQRGGIVYLNRQSRKMSWTNQSMVKIDLPKIDLPESSSPPGMIQSVRVIYVYLSCDTNWFTVGTLLKTLHDNLRTQYNGDKLDVMLNLATELWKHIKSFIVRSKSGQPDLRYRSFKAPDSKCVFTMHLLADSRNPNVTRRIPIVYQFSRCSLDTWPVLQCSSEVTQSQLRYLIKLLQDLHVVGAHFNVLGNGNATNDHINTCINKLGAHKDIKKQMKINTINPSPQHLGDLSELQDLVNELSITITSNTCPSDVVVELAKEEGKKWDSKNEPFEHMSKDSASEFLHKWLRHVISHKLKIISGMLKDRGTVSNTTTQKEKKRRYKMVSLLFPIKTMRIMMDVRESICKLHMKNVSTCSIKKRRNPIRCASSEIASEVVCNLCGCRINPCKPHCVQTLSMVKMKYVKP